MIDFTTYQYIPSVPLNNSSTDRKARPLVHRFGGEKRIEYIEITSSGIPEPSSVKCIDTNRLSSRRNGSTSSSLSALC
jgi:hypothetical protein